MRTKFFATLAILAPALPLLALCPASAQSMSGAPGKPNIVGKPQEKAKIAPPPAVPGATARPGTVAPADRTVADLPPTEALFDSINRGDIITARDAVARGADIDATNLLGLTPLELSVDLSRNDITFLLLSLRGGGSRGAAVQQASATPAAKPGTRQGIKHREMAAKATGIAAVEAPAPIRQTPALYAGNGGAAVPAAGFLGFDARK